MEASVIDRKRGLDCASPCESAGRCGHPWTSWASSPWPASGVDFFRDHGCLSGLKAHGEISMSDIGVIECWRESSSSRNWIFC